MKKDTKLYIIIGAILLLVVGGVIAVGTKITSYGDESRSERSSTGTGGVGDLVASIGSLFGGKKEK